MNIFEGYTEAAGQDSPGLTMADIEKAYQLVMSIKEQPKLYYALSEYLPDNDGIYKMTTPMGDLYAMHPDQFPKFEYYATRAGYQLLDIRQMPLVGIPSMRIIK